MNEELVILAVDDNEDDIFLLQQAFKKAGVKHHLQSASDGQEAVDYLKGEGIYGDRAAHPYPDALLLDLNMPRMNGFEVLKWVRQDPERSRLMVHVLTASARESDVEMAYYFRANSFVVKPTRLNDLIAFISALSQWHHFTVLSPGPQAKHTESPRLEHSLMAVAQLG